MPKTEKQKLKRKAKKQAAKIKQRAHGEAVLKAAMKSGYQPVNKKFVGKGDYSMARAKLRGRGDYLEDIANGGASLVGKGIRYVGEKALNWLGSAAKGLMGSLLGSGDYTASAHPRANSLSTTTSSLPQVESTRGRGNVVRNTEMIAEIFASDVLKTLEWHISPGLVNTFPWAHPFGDMYQEWRMNGGVVTYIPVVTPISDEAGGDLVINVEYDLEAPMPTTIQEVTGSYLAVAGRPLDRMVMAVECAPHETPYNVYLTRTTEVLDAPHFPYDLGKLRVTVANQPTASVGKMLGRLYFTYEMEFFKPMVRSIPLTIPFMYLDAASSSTSGAAPFGTSAATFEAWLQPQSTIKPTWVSATKIQLPSFVQSGKWLLIYQNTGLTPGSAAVDPTFTLTDADESKIFRLDDTTKAGHATSTTGTVLQIPTIVLLAFEVTAASPTIALTGGTWDSGYTTIQIVPLSGDILALTRALRVNRDFYDRKTREAALLQATISRAIEYALEEKKQVTKEDIKMAERRWNDLERVKARYQEQKFRQSLPSMGENACGELVIATEYEREPLKGRWNPDARVLERVSSEEYITPVTQEEIAIRDRRKESVPPNAQSRLRDPSPARPQG